MERGSRGENESQVFVVQKSPGKAVRRSRMLAPADPCEVVQVSTTYTLLRFGVFELNLDTEELRKDAIPIKLSPQPFRVLAMLAGRSGQIVTRAEIQKQIWGDETYVDFEHGMNQCIKQIRTALNDNADKPLYLETLPRRGYRFLAPVVSKTVAEPAPRVTESRSGIQNAITLPPTPQAGDSVRTSGSGAPHDTGKGLNRESVPGVASPISASVAVAAVPAAEPAPVRDSLHRIARSRLTWAAVMVAVLIAAGLYWRSRKFPAFTEKDSIVVSDFTNTTGDSVFDDTLKQGLSVQLEQSPFLDLVSEQKVSETLKLMGRSAGDRLTPEVTSEVCQRTGSKAMLTGSIVMLGSQYVIGLKAVNCNTGDLLAEAQRQATGKEAVLKALDRAAVSLRGQLGESLRSVQKYATPVEEATTPSLEALKAYSLGQKARFATGETAPLPFYKRAVELDPNFAMAYRAMSMTYRNLGEVGRATENARKAYELREKVTERERFSIEANYYETATGELEKAAQTYELWQQTYPRDYQPYGNLGDIYDKLGNREKALEEDREAMRLQPNQETVYANLGGDYANLNRLDEAEAVYKQAETRKLEGETLLSNRYELAFLKGDVAQMAQLVSAAMGKAGTEDILLALQADTEAWHGKLSNARELTRRAMDSALGNDAQETAAEYQAAAALREVASGNRERARAEARAAVKLAPNRGVQEVAALALARTGDTAKAERLAAELDQSFPLGTLIQRYWLPTIHAAVALQRKDPNRAIELLKVTSAMDLGSGGQLLPVYLRGEAYLMLHDGNAAVAEFQKFIEYRALIANFPWGALGRLGLARAYAEQGNTVKARAAYQDFLTLWKDADPDIPILIEAKAEYAKLQ